MHKYSGIPELKNYNVLLLNLKPQLTQDVAALSQCSVCKMTTSLHHKQNIWMMSINLKPKNIFLIIIYLWASYLQAHWLLKHTWQSELLSTHPQAIHKITEKSHELDDYTPGAIQWWWWCMWVWGWGKMKAADFQFMPISSRVFVSALLILYGQVSEKV